MTSVVAREPKPTLASKFLGGLRQDGLPILFLILAPILVAVVHDDWLYSPVGFPDPYFNVGFFMHYFDPDFLAGMYKEARVPWLVPGYFFYHVLGPMAANTVLHVGCLVGAVVFVYLTLARLISRNAAFIAAALICVYYQFQGSGTGGWDYQTTPSGLFYALTLYLLVRAAQTQYAAFWLVGAGMAFGATFHSNIIFVNLSLGVAAIYLAANRFQPTAGAILRAVAWGLLGFVLINLVFSVVAWDSGRDAMFFKSMFGLAASFTVDPATHQQRWWKPWSDGWFLRPLYLAYLLPLGAIFIASVAWLWSRIRGAISGLRPLADEGGMAPVVLVGQYVFAVLLWLVWQTQGQTALQPDYFAYPLIIPAFMALGVLIGPVGWRELIAFAVALVAVVVANTLIGTAGDTPQGPMIATEIVLGVMAVALLAGMAREGLRGLAALTAVAVYMAAYPAMALTHQSLQPLWSEMVGAPQPCISPRLYFSETVRLNKLLRQPRPDGTHVWMWDGPDEIFDAQCRVPVEYFRTTLMATGVDALGQYRATADQLTDNEIRQAKYGDRVVAIVKDKAQLQALTDRFKRAQNDIAQESEQMIHLGRATAWVAVYLVQ